MITLSHRYLTIQTNFLCDRDYETDYQGGQKAGKSNSRNLGKHVAQMIPPTWTGPGQKSDYVKQETNRLFVTSAYST